MAEEADLPVGGECEAGNAPASGVGTRNDPTGTEEETMMIFPARVMMKMETGEGGRG